jgi:hypothetical protein
MGVFESATILMKFSGFIHFGPLKTNPLSVFLLKIAVARENSANFDFLSKTAHFQIFFKNTFQIARYEYYISICSLRPVLSESFIQISTFSKIQKN